MSIKGPQTLTCGPREPRAYNWTILLQNIA